jgi:hypothetical protein
MRPADQPEAGAVAVPCAPAPAPLALDPGRYPRPVLIKAYLKGWESDLLTLADLFREGDPAIAADDEDYYLSFTVPDELFHDAGRLQATASVLLRRVNGLGRVFDHEFLPVGLIGRFSDETGQQQQVVLADSAQVRDRAFAAVVATEGEQAAAPAPPPPPGPGYVQMAEADPDAAEVLEILSKPDSPPDWVDLYKVLEILSKNVTGLPDLKGLPHLKKMGWVSPAQVEAFTASANHQGIGGGQARHARMGGTPSPRLMMTLIEAQQLIGALVKAWLDWRRSSSGR